MTKPRPPLTHEIEKLFELFSNLQAEVIELRATVRLLQPPTPPSPDEWVSIKKAAGIAGYKNESGIWNLIRKEKVISMRANVGRGRLIKVSSLPERKNGLPVPKQSSRG